MEPLNEKVLQEVGFKRLIGLNRWGYKGFNGVLTYSRVTNRNTFFLFGFNPGMHYKEDLEFIKRMIDALAVNSFPEPPPHFVTESPESS